MVEHDRKGLSLMHGDRQILGSLARLKCFSNTLEGASNVVALSGESDGEEWEEVASKLALNRQ